MTGLLAFDQAQGLLEEELSLRFGLSGARIQRYGDLLLLPELDSGIFSEKIPYWARTVLLEPFKMNFNSIGEAASGLREIQRNWAPYQFQLFRRASLIQQKLPYINLKEREFFKEGACAVDIPHSPMGIYTLLGEHELLASAKTTSCLPAGSIRFTEDHENPPSRAYLKLQEALVMARHYFGSELPSAGTRCLDAGASPGGWTWVLKELGAQVLAVDRAELSPELMACPQVEFVAHDAFTLRPQELGSFDWVFSDVICYPERLLGWARSWLDSGLTRRMICTIKLQGGADYKLIEEFARIPGSRVMHLNYNKHELTWIHG